ncbi:uncharacterized protein F5Z01DRAFT_93200 [Emericellopsis atlantica]|uniref:PLD phosphodiesterase domain-containing protein n=1 Tax=Emericellopsis atlantica TaxID=2614577 RepID=A0A9P7ZMH5_9HYPO|nr:uncharacterized protein F5Z01DRAFT_93200 [Emericellopsis atlantica]KAG9254755.1 hypothetical protein F5Z01DRAFT_93200 [Emericellopsis atlantica]
MVTDHLIKLTNVPETVSSVTAESPSESPGEIFHRLYGDDHHSASQSQYSHERVLECGKWGDTKPSPLFLRAFADAASCLDRDPLCGIVSPPLMGSHGTVPLTVIGPLIDVIRHVTNAIVRAKREVLLITSVWQPSCAQILIRDALVELSRRSQSNRVVVRIMFDKASFSNVWDPHRPVSEAEWTSKAIDLPSLEEIPNVDLDVASYHCVPLGTQHAKFCVVDGTSAMVMSCNMEDNDNMEMMTRLEGNVVQGLRDTALLCWGKSLGRDAQGLERKNSGVEVGEGELRHVRSNDLKPEIKNECLVPLMPDQPHYDVDIASEIRRVQANHEPGRGETPLQATNRVLNMMARKQVPPSGPEIAPDEVFTPYITTLTPQDVPIAMVSRSAYGPVDKSNVHVPQNEAWLSLIRNAERSVFIQTPDLNTMPVTEAIVDALTRGVEVTVYLCFGYNDAGEMIPGQGGTNEQATQRLLAMLPADGPAREKLHAHDYVGKDQNYPIHASFKARSCHVKILIVDDCVGVQGSGNQDTQTWYHSQEVNVMVDSPLICRAWREGLERNQNTHQFGAVAEDGIWRDADGNPGEGYRGNPGVLEGILWGAGGMFKKLKDSHG